MSLTPGQERFQRAIQEIEARARVPIRRVLERPFGCFNNVTMRLAAPQPEEQIVTQPPVIDLTKDDDEDDSYTPPQRPPTPEAGPAPTMAANMTERAAVVQALHEATIDLTVYDEETRDDLEHLSNILQMAYDIDMVLAAQFSQ